MICPKCGAAAPSQYTDSEDVTCPVCNVRMVMCDGPTARRNPILQDWVTFLGLRHQGVLLTGVRGCDTAPKDDPSKLFARCVRNMILRPHCGDAAKAVSFIEAVDDATLTKRFRDFIKNCDHYPHHYVMHMVHVVEIIGYDHPDKDVCKIWTGFYYAMCSALHMNPEPRGIMDDRLNADEETFGKMQKMVKP